MIITISDLDGISVLKQDLNHHFDMKILHNRFTPPKATVRFTSLDGIPLHNPTLYRTLVGSLAYLTVTRPHIARDVHLVSFVLDLVSHVRSRFKYESRLKLSYKLNSKAILLKVVMDVNTKGPRDARLGS
ncbi:hypothetical protein RJ639_045554 [Escallonia herrerae]|uniref:Reverse transcriptase n=1 Tax=Escallonia herrerae TaxID=1293975 RepID=A0AA88W4V5_9ASTE|nr:hypothetical protein RJ639_045554 [Escallonia herrerae]